MIGAARSRSGVLDQAPHVRPAIILLDLNMPDLPAAEVIWSLRALLPSVGVIIVSLHDCELYRQMALAIGADEFVHKAKHDTDLLPAVRRVLRADRPQEKPIDGGALVQDDQGGDSK